MAKKVPDAEPKKLCVGCCNDCSTQTPPTIGVLDAECPHCGAPIAVDEDTRCGTCYICGYKAQV